MTSLVTKVRVLIALTANTWSYLKLASSLAFTYLFIYRLSLCEAKVLTLPSSSLNFTATLRHNLMLSS